MSAADQRLAAQAAAKPAAAGARGHVPALDLVRVLTFAAVIAVHVVSYDGHDNVAANGSAVLLHFTREAFFAMTGFVLVHQYQNRKYQIGRFYRRRLKGVGIPYVAWSLIYSLVTWYQGPRTETLSHWLSQFGRNLLDGGACYHLYFLVVSMQVYLLFPLIEWLVRVTRRHHLLLLVLSAAIQVAVTVLIQYPPRDGALHWFVRYSSVLFVSYQFYILLGAVTAAHLEEISAWVRRWWPILVVALAASVALAEGVYLHKVDDGVLPRNAAAVLQPAMLPIAAATIAVLFAVGTWWADHRRRGGPAERFLTTGSDRSFGIFLVHPLILRFLSQLDGDWWPRGVNALPLTLVRYLIVVLGSIVATEIFRRTWLSLPLAGRPMLASRRSARSGAPAPDRKDTADDRQRAPGSLLR